MKAATGFLKLSQEFRENVENGKYFPVLDKLTEIASRNHNNLPYSFSIKKPYDLTLKDVDFVLSKLYPERNYSCNMANDDIFCIRT